MSWRREAHFLGSSLWLCIRWIHRFCILPGCAFESSFSLESASLSLDHGVEFRYESKFAVQSRVPAVPNMAYTAPNHPRRASPRSSRILHRVVMRISLKDASCPRKLGCSVPSSLDSQDFSQRSPHAWSAESTKHCLDWYPLHEQAWPLSRCSSLPPNKPGRTRQRH